MEFNENKAIYLQIVDRICNEILQGKYIEDERIPSIREYAAEVEVNVNTMVRSYEVLQQQNIIYNKRGIGYFVASDAKKIIYTTQKDIFMNEELTTFFKQIHLLEIPIEKIVDLYNKYIKHHNV